MSLLNNQYIEIKSGNGIAFATFANGRRQRGKPLPMLSPILGFPTTIILDRKGRVRNIHTGFSGPATGIHYEKWKQDFTELVEKLMSE